MPYQVQGVDLPSIFLAAQQARANEQAMRLNQIKLAEAQRQEDVQRWLPQARADFFGGDPTDLQRLAPEEALKFQSAQAERQALAAKAQASAAETQAKQQGAAEARRLRTSRTMLQAIDAYQKNPSAYGAIREQMRGLWSQGLIDQVQLPDQPPPPGSPELQQMRAVLASQVSAEKPTTKMQEALFAARGDERLATELLKKWNESSGQKINVNVGADGNIGLTQGVQAAQQTQVLGADAVLAQLDNLDQLASEAGGVENILTGSTQLRNKAAGIVDKFAPALTSKATEAELARAQAFDAANQSMVNEYVKMLTGSGVTGSDLERSLAAIPNKGDSPAQYRAKMKSLRQRLEQSRKLGVGALVGGISQERQTTTGNAEPPAAPDINADTTWSGQQLSPPAVQAARREPPPQAVGIDISAPAAPRQGRVPTLEIPADIMAGPDLSGAAGPQAMPPQSQAVRREPPATTAQPTADLAMRGEQIVAAGISGGKVPSQIADELISAGVLKSANRAKAIENLNRRFMKQRRGKR